MVSPAINIRGYAIEALSLEPLVGFDPETQVISKIAVEFNFGVENPRSFATLLRIRLEKEDESDGLKQNLPYSTVVGIRGWFETPFDLNSKLVPAPMANNALMVLYGTLRGFLAQTTSMFSNGPMVLPAVTFEEMVANAARQPSSAVVPVDMPRSEPGAAEAFGFIFAIDDLPRAVATVQDDEVRGQLTELARGLRQLTESQPDVTAPQQMRSHLTTLVTLVENADEPSRDLIKPLLARINAGLERLEAMRAAVTTGDEGKSTD